MAVYASAASNKSQPLNLDYVDSAAMVNQMCGPTFVNDSIPNAVSKSKGGTAGGSNGKTSAASRGRGFDDAVFWWKGWLGLLVGMASFFVIVL